MEGKDPFREQCEAPEQQTVQSLDILPARVTPTHPCNVFPAYHKERPRYRLMRVVWWVAGVLAFVVDFLLFAGFWP
jgi:hypothetical protein